MHFVFADKWVWRWLADGGNWSDKYISTKHELWLLYLSAFELLNFIILFLWVRSSGSRNSDSTASAKTSAALGPAAEATECTPMAGFTPFSPPMSTKSTTRWTCIGWRKSSARRKSGSMKYLWSLKTKGIIWLWYTTAEKCWQSQCTWKRSEWRPPTAKGWWLRLCSWLSNSTKWGFGSTVSSLNSFRFNGTNHN